MVWLLRVWGGIPLIHTAHSWGGVKNPSRGVNDSPKAEPRRICEQQLSDNADVLVVNTEDEKNELIAHYDANDCHISVITPGADT